MTEIFKAVKDHVTKEISKTQIIYIDSEGQQWFVPLECGNRYETMLDEYLANGGVVQPAD